MYEDDDGNLWVGTWGSGISRFTPATGELRQFTERNGLPNNFIKGILCDNRNNLWIATERGLSRFSMKEERFRNFDVHDGVQGNLFYSGSCWKGRDGRLYFGGENGLNAFYPDSIKDEEFSPPVVITALRVVDQPRALSKTLSSIDNIVLTHEENMFSFEFVALDYSAPERNQYAYRLEGFNNNWTEAGARRYASYTHLDPGEYHFVVRGTNSDGIWSNTLAGVSITILPAYWQTWWFRGGVLVAVFSLLYGFFRYRLNKLLEIERTRSAIATDLHDDIGASLTSIALFSDLARKEITSHPSQAAERLQRIADSSRVLLDKMNDIVWSINPENDSLEDIFLRMKELAVGMLGAKGIEYGIDIPAKIPDIKLPMSVRRNLFLIYKEILHNIVKHSQSTRTEITVGFESGQSMLTIQVNDNGKGFDPVTAKRGYGLNNIEKRAELLHAKVRFTSAVDSGSAVNLLIPLKSPL